MGPKFLIWATGRNKLLLINLRKDAKEQLLEKEINSLDMLIGYPDGEVD